VSVADIKREFREVPTGLIDEPSRASRSSIDEDYIDELALDIRLKGLLEPILIGRKSDRYEVIAGHCRLLACRRAGLVVIPCLVYPSTDVELEGVKYSENRFRRDLPAAQEAIYFAEILETDAAGDVDKLCELLGEKRAYVEGRLLLFQGDPKVFEALDRGDITIGVAQQLNRCDEQLHRRMLLDNAIRGGATVALVSGWISEWFTIHKPANRNVPSDAGSATPGPVPQTDYFRCAVCGKNTDVHLMQPVNIHTYCKQATFDDMLALWTRRHEFTRWPRSLDEARALIVEISDRFPEVADPPDPRRV
jgi:ParB/RepB/Spo0J family partition protein